MVDTIEVSVTEQQVVVEATEDDTVAVVIEESVKIVEGLISGPQGTQGLTGPGGQSYRYVHSQLVAANVWTVTHNLNGKPGGIGVFDTAGTEYEVPVEHLSDNQFRVTFSNPTSGFVYVS